MASVVLEEQSLGFSTEIVHGIECCLIFVELGAEAREKPISSFATERSCAPRAEPGGSLRGRVLTHSREAVKARVACARLAETGCSHRAALIVRKSGKDHSY